MVSTTNHIMADLLTARDVQDMLQVDRTTIYRMAESGQLPAMRVGKQWRFARADLERWLRAQTGAPTAGPVMPSTPHADPDTPLAQLLPMPCAQMIQDAFADALGVMMVITDMQGQPVTDISNPCGLYVAIMREPDAVAHCVSNWQRLAGNLTLEPKFSASELGLLCARGLIRTGNALKGMVFVGGIAPDPWPPAAGEVQEMAQRFHCDPAYVQANVTAVYHLDRSAQERALQFVQRIADIFSHILEDRTLVYARLQAIASLTAL